VYVEAADAADIYLTPLAHYDEEYRGREGRQIEDWRMSEDLRRRYADDHSVKHLHVTFDRTGWAWK
jgi:hypothetical protein